MRRILLGLTGALLLGIPAAGAPRELGTIDWLRSLDEGVARAKEAERPVLLLFQEVPG